MIPKLRAIRRAILRHALERACLDKVLEYDFVSWASIRYYAAADTGSDKMLTSLAASLKPEIRQHIKLLAKGAQIEAREVYKQELYRAEQARHEKKRAWRVAQERKAAKLEADKANLEKREAALRSRTLTLPGTDELLKLFEQARGSFAKKLTIRTTLADDTDLAIILPGAGSKLPGHIVLALDAGYTPRARDFTTIRNRYKRGADEPLELLGVITPDKELCLSVRGGRLRDPLLQKLAQLIEDPAAVAAEHGHLTGACCFCAKPLTDERSVTAGYGADCAKRYGLRWGTREGTLPANVAVLDHHRRQAVA